MIRTGAPYAESPRGAPRPVRPTRLSPGVSIYLVRQFLGAFLLVFILFVAIILIVDLIELLRRASGKESATFGVVLNMALYKLPQTVQKTMPFAILFGGMLGFWRLNRTSELIALRASGVSVWHFVLPVVFAAALLGIVKISVINPMGTILIGHYEQLENRHLKGRSPLMAATHSGVWLRQPVDDGQAVIHAKSSSVERDTLTLHDVMVLRYGPNDRFDGRIDSATAVLRDGQWQMQNTLLFVPGEPPVRKAVHAIPTTLTLASIQESFSSPRSVSFWDLPRFIDSLEALGIFGPAAPAALAFAARGADALLRDDSDRRRVVVAGTTAGPGSCWPSPAESAPASCFSSSPTSSSPWRIPPACRPCSRPGRRPWQRPFSA